VHSALKQLDVPLFLLGQLFVLLQELHDDVLLLGHFFHRSKVVLFRNRYFSPQISLLVLGLLNECLVFILKYLDLSKVTQRIVKSAESFTHHSIFNFHQRRSLLRLNR